MILFSQLGLVQQKEKGKNMITLNSSSFISSFSIFRSLSLLNSPILITLLKLALIGLLEFSNDK